MPLVQWVECLPNTHEVQGSIPDCLSGMEVTSVTPALGRQRQNNQGHPRAAEWVRNQLGSGKATGSEEEEKRAQTYLLGKSFLEHNWGSESTEKFPTLTPDLVGKGSEHGTQTSSSSRFKKRAGA